MKMLYEPVTPPLGAEYTHRPNPELVCNKTESCGSTKVRSPKIKEGVSFREPLAGQGFNDQFPWR